MEQLSILTQPDAHSYFLLDGSFPHFYYLTNDRYGEAILRLLCDTQQRRTLDVILADGLHEGIPNWRCLLYTSSIGVNVGHTGGSMLGEAMVAFKGVSLAAGMAGKVVGNFADRASSRAGTEMCIRDSHGDGPRQPARQGHPRRSQEREPQVPPPLHPLYDPHTKQGDQEGPDHILVEREKGGPGVHQVEGDL